MGIGEDDLLKASVTVMPILGNKIGFLRRDYDDSFPNLLIAPGGSIETPDGDDIDGVMYNSIEKAAVRELLEKTGIRVNWQSLKYFCSMSLPTMRVVTSWYCYINLNQVARSLGYLEFYGDDEIKARNDFAPGMKHEALLLVAKLNQPAQPD